MLNLLLKIFWIPLSIYSFAQNLIPNGGFEEVNICCELNQPCAPGGWFNSNFSYKATGIAWGKEVSSGDNAIKLSVSIPGRDDFRNYIMAPLICPLIKDKEYHFSIKVKASGYAINSLGVLFSVKPVFNHKPELIRTKPTLSFEKDSGWLRNQNQWIELYKDFKASGDEKIITIGNFSPDDKLSYQQLSRNAQSCEYLLDDVSLTPLQGVQCSDHNDNLKKIMGEKRRHYFSINCSNPEFVNLFPELLNDSFLAEEYLHLTYYNQYLLQNLEFETDQSVLRSASFPEVNKLLILMFQEPSKKVMLTGFTDDSGSKAHNLKLSHQRAKAVATYLVKMGIGWERVKFEGKGSSHPLDSSGSDAGRARNRRVEFKLSQ